MSALKKLHVFYNSDIVGKLYLDPSGELCFEYSQAWLKSKDAFPLSYRMPLQNITYVHDAQVFFGNLLPEGHVRKLTSGRLGLSELNDFSLLEALGEDCAGAFRILVSEDGRLPSSGLTEISLIEVAKIYQEQPLFSLGFQEKEVRLSLAGAQDKIPVIYKNEKLFLPNGNTASTHILKFPNRDYAFITENEYYVSQLAADCGLNVMPCQLLCKGDFAGFLSNRYDRKISGQVTQRIHQEDFCQILGISHQQKYQEEGGPNFLQCFEFIESESSKVLEDLEQLLRWLFFNVCVGNCDNHGKNLSTIIFSRDHRELSPFYDLICTKVYPTLSKKQAMSIGGSFDASNISALHWKKQMKEINFNYNRFVEEICLPIVDIIQVRAEEHLEVFENRPSREFIRKIKSMVLECTRRAEKSVFEGF